MVGRVCVRLVVPWLVVLLVGGCAGSAAPTAENGDKPAAAATPTSDEKLAEVERKLVDLRSEYERSIDRLNQLDSEVRALAPPKPTDAPAKPAPLAAEPLAPPAENKLGIHLATYQKKESVQEGWSDYRKQYRGVLDGLEPRIATIDLHDGRGTLYRLLAGPFGSAADARDACRKVHAYPAGYCRVMDFSGVAGAAFWGKPAS